ncbi:MAG: HAMP domain-containing protein [Methylococcaceae bacterium]|nr:HAMP domain-containing protein [Methylococcaceae bacterium]
MKNNNNSNARETSHSKTEPDSKIKLKLSFLRNVKLANKLNFGFAFLFIMMAIVSGLSLYGLQSVNNNFRYAIDFGVKLERLSSEAENQLLQARRREKDFLLRWKTLGFEAAKEKYITKNKVAIDNVRKSTAQMLAILPDDHKAGTRSLFNGVKSLNQEIDIYTTEFAQLTELIEKHGFNHSGFEGAFRKEAHKVEEAINKANILAVKTTLLMLRRHEKDYLLRGDGKYIKKVSDTLVELKIELKQKKLSPEVLSNLNLALDDYWNSFEKLTNIKDEINITTNRFRRAAHRIEDAAIRFKEIGYKESQKYIQEAKEGSSKTIMLAMTSFSVILVIGLLLSYLLASHIKMPISLLDETVMSIRKGNYSAIAPVITSDEVGRLAETFNEMNLDLTQALAKIKQQVEDIRKEREISEELLCNILPKPIASRLKEEETIAEWFGQVTIIFCDIVGFTELSSILSATDLVSRLNKVFSAFDEMSTLYGLEKIKTIGDCYMAVGGLPVACEEHAEIVADMALGMLEKLESLNLEFDRQLQIRIGINSGPVVAGVIGKSKFIYDLWGDAVNVASRMESHGIIGKIHVSESSYNLLKSKYIFEQRGIIDIKGKGNMTTYFLISKKDIPEILEEKVISEIL